jgi:acetyltransferase-like isoleucine patch superfamily enzyme
MAEGRRGAQDALQDAGSGALAKYRRLMVGDAGFGAFLAYEFVTSVFGPWPGALGYWLRAKFYPGLFRACGRKVIFGRNLTIRHPGRISIGDRVVLSDGVMLDAKGASADGGIVVGAGAFVGLCTMITTTDGSIELAAGCNLGAYCRIGSFGRTRIGEKALLAAWVYVVGAGHESARTDIPILDQPYTHRGGAQIGDGAWLGARATVMDGVTVGAHSIVGAHAVVTKDIPDYSIAMGIPARVTGSRLAPPAAG